MREWQNQSHVRWYCRYPIVIVPKYRQTAIFGTLRKDIGKILRELCDQMGIELVEGHAMPDHVHLCWSMPPKYRVANTVGRLKGKSAIRIHQVLRDAPGFSHGEVSRCLRSRQSIWCSPRGGIPLALAMGRMSPLQRRLVSARDSR